ncbi:MAG: ankyrin repeat domain-containing protein [Elusimicrobia bacterium]|nr:ankyrin repeat domain-containing protein [Elusimicrobiota bacterium]
MLGKNSEKPIKAGQSIFSQFLDEELRSARVGDTDCLSALLQAGNAYIDLRDCQGQSALMIAAYHDHAPAVEALLKRGADANLMDYHGQTALDLAAKFGHGGVVRILAPRTLRQPAPPANVLDAWALRIEREAKDRLDVLHWAARFGHMRTIVRLLREGIDVNKAIPSQSTALFMASFYGHAEAAEALLKHGADPEAKPGKWSPLGIAAFRGHPHVVRILLEHGAAIRSKPLGDSMWTPLLLASSQSHHRVAAILLEHGDDPNADTRKQQTPQTTALMWAAYYGNAALAELLIGHGCIINARDRGGRTALDYALRSGRSEVAQLLLRRGAKPSRADRSLSFGISWPHIPATSGPLKSS